ncbi:hypothetical protein D3C86_1571600 [compost metagenome]
MHARIPGDLQQHIAGLLDVAGVVDAQVDIDAARGFARIVGDIAVGQAAIRHYHHLVVGGFQGGVEDLDAVDAARYALPFDPVAGTERPEQHDQHTTGEVRQAALQRQTYGQAGGTDHRDEGGGFHPNHRGHADQQQHLEDDTGQATDEAVQSAVDVAPIQHGAYFAGQHVDQPPTDQQGDERQGQLTAVLQHHRQPGLGHFHQLLDIHFHLPLLFDT